MDISNSIKPTTSDASAAVDAYTGEVRAFATKFVPQGWAECAGQILDIPSYRVVHSLLGVSFGGDGRITIGLPDLRGRTLMGRGASMERIGSEDKESLVKIKGPDRKDSILDLRVGQTGGNYRTTLSNTQLPEIRLDTQKIAVKNATWNTENLKLEAKSVATGKPAVKDLKAETKLPSIEVKQSKAGSVFFTHTNATSMVHCNGTLGSGVSNDPASRFPAQIAAGPNPLYSASGPDSMNKDMVKTTLDLGLDYKDPAFTAAYAGNPVTTVSFSVEHAVDVKTEVSVKSVGNPGLQVPVAIDAELPSLVVAGTPTPQDVPTLPPYCAVVYAICMSGTYPDRVS